MKFEFNWANGLWENFDLVYRWDSNMSYLAERSNANIDPWNLFIAIVSLVGQGQPRIIIWTNLVGPTSPMLHTMSQGHRFSGSGAEDF